MDDYSRRMLSTLVRVHTRLIFNHLIILMVVGNHSEECETARNFRLSSIYLFSCAAAVEPVSRYFLLLKRSDKHVYLNEGRWCRLPLMLCCIPKNCYCY